MTADETRSIIAAQNFRIALRATAERLEHAAQVLEGTPGQAQYELAATYAEISGIELPGIARGLKHQSAHRHNGRCGDLHKLTPDPTGWDGR